MKNHNEKFWVKFPLDMAAGHWFIADLLFELLVIQRSFCTTTENSNPVCFHGFVGSLILSHQKLKIKMKALIKFLNVTHLEILVCL